MRNRKVQLFFLVLAASVFRCMPVYALDVDLNYSYQTKNTEEFVIVGKPTVHINGQIPDFLLDIYDITPQMAYHSAYGSNVIVPDTPKINSTTYAPRYAPVSSYIASSSGLGMGIAESGGTNGNDQAAIADTTKIPEQFYGHDALQYPLTPIEQVRNGDGSIGTLVIPKIDLKVTAYDGDTFSAMKKGIGHISSTSCWNGNIGLVGHNRGTNDYFGKLKKLKPGDQMTYETNLGKRTYVVQSVTKISDTDWSKLQYTSDHRLTLITCVENVGDQRLCVQATEKK